MHLSDADCINYDFVLGEQITVSEAPNKLVHCHQI